MDPSLHEILDDILKVRAVLHDAGTVSGDVLRALARHASDRKIRRSVETGCGATTLLLSHLSEHHTAFALNAGGSVSHVRRSPLLRHGIVTFVEGPSQRTLPQHRFEDKLQLALLDGPHAYPFPDLEYYFLYPHLEPGALLVLDDIQIKSIHNLFQFLRSDVMFRLDEVVRTTAFFTRTDAPTFNTMGDGWREQRYNRRTLLRYDWRTAISSVLPRSAHRSLAAYRSVRAEGDAGSFVKIVSPRYGEYVSSHGLVGGQAGLSVGAHLWVLVRRKDVDGWWPQGSGPVSIVDGGWTVEVTYGGPHDSGFEFEIAAVVVAQPVHENWMEWVRSVQNTGEFPPVHLPRAPHVLAESFQTVRKQVA
jgi:methyltransferase family protein